MICNRGRSWGYPFSYTLRPAPRSLFYLRRVRPAGSGLQLCQMCWPSGLWASPSPGPPYSTAGTQHLHSSPAALGVPCMHQTSAERLTPKHTNLLCSFPPKFWKNKINFCTLSLPFFSIPLLNPVSSPDIFRVHGWGRHEHVTAQRQRFTW